MTEPVSGTLVVYWEVAENPFLDTNIVEAAPQQKPFITHEVEFATCVAQVNVAYSLVRADKSFQTIFLDPVTNLSVSGDPACGTIIDKMYLHDMPAGQTVYEIDGLTLLIHPNEAVISSETITLQLYTDQDVFAR